jgi:hypothetical protein
MFTMFRRIGVMALVTGAALALTAPPARAQVTFSGGYTPFFRVRPGLTLQQMAYNLNTIYGVRSQYSPYVLGYNPYRGFNYGPYTPPINPYANSLYANPYAAYTNPYAAASLYSNPYSSSPGYGGGGYDNSLYSNPYSGGYYQDPYNGYLTGAASVINAQGRFLVNNQQALQMREQVLQDRQTTRRRIFDEYLYEREHTPTPEDNLDRYLKERFRHSVNNPDVTEIWSGKALNDILANLKKVQPKVDTAALRTFDDRPLDEDTLKGINVTKGTGGNIGLLRGGGKLAWPTALSGDEFKEIRERINTLVQDAIKQAEFNSQVDAGYLRDLRDNVDLLQKDLRRNGTTYGFNQYNEAKTFLANLDDAITALRQKDVGEYFNNGKYVIKAKSTPDLIKYMIDNGLSFAPATPGNESAYAALHQKLAGYSQAARDQITDRR